MIFDDQCKVFFCVFRTIAVIVSHICVLVPSAPKGLQLMLVSEDPPAVSVMWQAPRFIYGILEGYRLTFGITGETEFEEKRLDAEKFRLTTGYLGMLLCL